MQRPNRAGAMRSPRRPSARARFMPRQSQCGASWRLFYMNGRRCIMVSSLNAEWRWRRLDARPLLYILWLVTVLLIRPLRKPRAALNLAKRYKNGLAVTALTTMNHKKLICFCCRLVGIESPADDLRKSHQHKLPRSWGISSKGFAACVPWKKATRITFGSILLMPSKRTLV